MDYFLVIEGAQGVGKTTVTTLLREQIPYSNLYRLSGIKDKSEEGLKKISKHYKNLLNYFKEEEDIGFTSIFDRLFTTEQLYSRIGHAKYDFTEVYNELVAELEKVKSSQKIKFYLLTSNQRKFEKTLSSRGEKVQHANIKFSVEESMNQQNIFLELFKELETKFDVRLIDTSARTAQEVADIIKEDINGTESN